MRKNAAVKKEVPVVSVAAHVDADLASILGSDVSPAGAAETVSDIEVSEALHSLELNEAVKSVQASVPGADQPEAVVEVKTEVAATEPAKKTRTSTVGMKPSEILTAKLGNAMNDVLTLTTDLIGKAPKIIKESVSNFLESVDKLPKKVGEKVVNLIAHIHAGAELSVYTKIALDILLSTGELSTTTLRDAYIKNGYSSGTANAQASQMFSLLPAMKIATKSGKTLTLDSTSTIAKFIKAK